MRMATSAPSPSWRRAGLWMYVIAVIYAAISLVPFLWSIYTSVKPTSEVFQLFVPWRTLTLSSYTSILQNFPFGRWFLNSAIVAFIVTVGNLVVNTFAGYAFARLRFPGRGFLFYVFLGVMMIPGQVVLVPIYMLLARPLLAAQTILTFQGNWNSFLWPLLIGQTTNMYTLPVGLNSFYGQYNAYWNSVMAGMVLLTVPMMVVFIIFQRQFIQGVSQAGLKG